VHLAASAPPPMRSAAIRPAAAPACAGGSTWSAPWSAPWRKLFDRVGVAPSRQAPSPAQLDLGPALARIDWDADPDALMDGDLSLLLPSVAALISEAAALAAVEALAHAAGVAPVVAVIALLAKAAGGASRSAGRIARGLIGKADAAAVARAMAALGLHSLSPTP